MSFWDKVVVDTQPVQVQAPASRRAWWQEPDPLPMAQYGQPVSGPSRAMMSRDARYQSLKKSTVDGMSSEDMEFMAEYELGLDKYNTSCPHCGSSNYVPAGTRIAGTTMPSEKCFECGRSARGPEPQRGGRAKGTATATRQIDTGGAVTSMYMKFNGVPSGYMPRA